jgi:CBS domain containing-hemolysin-like protein
MHRWQALGRPPLSFRLQAFLHKVPFAPETKFLYELLEEFQQQRYHMAAVVDEFGTVIGLVTVEDALEQIVGEIREEHERPNPGELQSADEPVEIDGITNVRDLASLYRIKLPYDAGFETLAGFLLSRLGHIPREAEEVEFDGRTYTVVKMEHNRIAQVRIEQITASQIAGGPEVGEAENG